MATAMPGDELTRSQAASDANTSRGQKRELKSYHAPWETLGQMDEVFRDDRDMPVFSGIPGREQKIRFPFHSQSQPR